MESQDQKNLMIAIVLSLVVFLGWSYVFPQPTMEPQKQTQQASVPQTAEAPITAPTQADVPKAAAKTEIKRVLIDTPQLSGSIRLNGARFDDLVLKAYGTTVKEGSPRVKLLVPSNEPGGYFADFGWSTNDGTMDMPNADTLWHVEGESRLAIDHPLVLSFTNPQGLQFKRTIKVDANYLFTIEDQVVNHSDRALTLAAYGRVNRAYFKNGESFYILHEGAMGFFSNDKDQALKFADMESGDKKTFESNGGWLGLTDKYWLAALIPVQNQEMSANYHFVTQGNDKSYQVDFLGKGERLEKGATLSATQHLFAGPKILDLLDSYESTLGIKHFDLAVDFGIFYFLTKPIFLLLVKLNEYLGSFGIAILLFTVMLKALFFPLANKSYRSMAHMRALQPQMEKIRVQFADDKMRMNQEIMQLYQKEKVNPMAGCLPMLLQIPVFFALYKVLFVTIEMRHTPFYGWIHDMSAPDPTTLFNLFGLIPWAPPAFLMIGAWPLIMGATMLIQQKLSPPPADPAQAKMFMLMPVLFTFMLANFPAGLVIYWAWNNVLTIAQQWTIMRMEEKRMQTKGNK